MSGRVRRRARVRGRVQGVWFRGSTREEALRQDVSGWVCNHRDGSVEAVFEGEPEAVARLVEFCRHGPPGAAVTELVEAAEPPRNLSGFRIEPSPPPGES